MPDPEALRILWLLRSRNYTQRQSAQALGVSEQLISDVVRARSRLSRDLAETMAQHFGVSLDWLLLGTGAPFPLDMEAPTTTTLPGERTARVRRFPPRCEACSQEVREGDKFCPGCHASLLWPPAEG
jgi:transcriptional regulator with XRE-family HTH domain